VYQAELRGKIPRDLKRSEDLLTSNVFSFLKYADREIFLREFLERLGLRVSSSELEHADFTFWPVFEDGTEPDVVVTVGDYYILFEAKYLSGFGIGESIEQNQIAREITGGSLEAKALKKVFLFFAITSHAAYPGHEILGTPRQNRDQVRWINWQSIACLLLDLINKFDDALPDFDFAHDLYKLLDDKNLRSFFGFDRLNESSELEHEGFVFFSPETAKFRGDFIGFEKALVGAPLVECPERRMWFKRIYFSKLKNIIQETTGDESIFWEGT